MTGIRHRGRGTPRGGSNRWSGLDRRIGALLIGLALLLTVGATLFVAGDLRGLRAAEVSTGASGGEAPAADLRPATSVRTPVVSVAPEELATRVTLAEPASAEPERDLIEDLKAWMKLVSRSGTRSVSYLTCVRGEWKLADLRPLREAILESGWSTSELLEFVRTDTEHDRSYRAMAQLATTFAPGFEAPHAQQLAAVIPVNFKIRNDWDVEKGSAAFTLLHRGRTDEIVEAVRYHFPIRAPRIGDLGDRDQGFIAHYADVSSELGVPMPADLADWMLDEGYYHATGTRAAWRHRTAFHGEVLRTIVAATDEQSDNRGFPRGALAATTSPWARHNLVQLCRTAGDGVYAGYLKGSALCGLIGIGDPASLHEAESLLVEAAEDQRLLSFLVRGMSEDLHVPSAVNAVHLLASTQLSLNRKQTVLRMITKHARPLGWSPILDDQRAKALQALDRAIESAVAEPEFEQELRDLRALIR